MTTSHTLAPGTDQLASAAAGEVDPRPMPGSDRNIERALSRISGVPQRSGNAVHLLQDGPNTFDDWLEAIASAQRYIHLENYIFQCDGIGRTFAAALAERAAAGVSVRVLYDWFGSSDVPGRFWRELRASGVDVRPVNSPGLGAPLSAINRDHRKYLGVDGCYASTGGVCIADPWLTRSPVTGLPYRDTAVSVRGPVVADFEAAFARVWDSTGAPLPRAERPGLAEMRVSGDILARAVAAEPGRMRMLWLLQMMLAGVERRAWLADAYFLAMPSLREALIAAAGDGVDVRILLPATNDLPVVGALSRSSYRPLLQAGIRIWEYAGPMMHAKTTVIDGWLSRVGSTNLNVTGLLTNWELDLMVEDLRFGAEMEAIYEDDLAHAREIRLGRTRGRPRPQPTRHFSRAERRGRTERMHGSVRAVATVARAGAVLQAATSDQLRSHERTVGGAIGAGLVSVALLAARFPRLVAWPLAAVGGLYGSVTLLRAARSAPPDGSAPASGTSRRGRRHGRTRRRPSRTTESLKAIRASLRGQRRNGH